MTRPALPETAEYGFDLPARPGMDESEILSPCLILDLDALERNVAKMGAHIARTGMRHRAHGKMHRSPDVYFLQERLGKACGICCQKVAEAEVFARAGVRDILVSNQVRNPVMIRRLARLPLLGARTLVCVDDIANVAELSAAAVAEGTEIEALVEVDCGANRCGVTSPEAALEIARAIDAAPGLRFAGVQAYQGAMQHIEDHAGRQAAADKAIAFTQEVTAMLEAEGLTCDIIGGGGTGSYAFESASGLYNELQCGSYAFMDADYGHIRDAEGKRLDAGEWENALFLLTTVISKTRPSMAVVDAGLKSVAVDSGLPFVFGAPDLDYARVSDEHGVILDPTDRLKAGDRLRLVPGHCDPTCNLHDWYVGVRGGKVEVVWPIAARGKSY